MPSTRRQKAKARKSREMDIMSDFDNIDVMIVNENTNSIERELANAIEESSALGDFECYILPRKEFRETNYKKRIIGQMKRETTWKPFSNEFNLRLSQEMDSMMAMMHSPINRAIISATSDRVIPEIKNTMSSMSSSGNRDMRPVHPQIVRRIERTILGSKRKLQKRTLSPLGI